MQVKVSLINQEDENFRFKELLKQQKKTILYFYPKDNTPGCTLEAKDFSDAYPLFIKSGISVYGISRDSSQSHCNFISKNGLSIPLISDPELELHKKYGARGEKKNYGKSYMGTIRSTYLVDQNGEILQSRNNVKAKGHVQRIIDDLKLE